MERLTFNVGQSRGGPLIVAGRSATASPFARARRQVAAAREHYDWDYLWMLAFTALLFFRPQDQIPGLEALHLSELTAIAGLAAMAVRRLSSGQTIAHFNPEVIGVIVLGAVLLATLPFSIWPGGSLTVFTDIYSKIILIVALMMSTITSPRRVRQMTWVMIVASGYIASRAVFDYVRGVNLVEGDRVRGAVGGMFENPNDLALNLVTFLAPTLFIVLHGRRASHRLLASALGLAMLAAIVCTKSRSGFLGLIAMGAVVMYYTMRIKPAVVAGVLLAGLVALPAMPASFWTRMDSIVNEEEDQSGSRAARLRLIDQGVMVFLENPITGIGAGQFKNYNAPGVVEKWRVTHNVWLQVAAELGIFGLLVFGFLVVRTYTASLATLQMLRGPRKKRGGWMTDRGLRTANRGNLQSNPQPADRTPQGAEAFTDDERGTLDMNAKAMLAGIVGWTICACFASVAFNWTFYFVLALAVSGREIVARRLAAEPVQKAIRLPRFARAHAS
jgi:O-antigen ligase